MKIESKSLMLGDWVKSRTGMNVKIVSIEHDYPSVYDPIPLTAEILEKNGFAKVNTQRYDLGNPNGFYVNINPKKKIIHINGANGSNCNMYYIIVGFNVHTLQHALRLCGLDDLANNFKID